MKRENIEHAIGNISAEYISEAVNNANKKKNKKSRLLPKLLVPAAALLCVLMFGVNAASPVDLGFYLERMYGGDYTMVDEIVSMPSVVSYRSSGDEVKLELKGVLGDSATAVIYFDVVVSPEVEIPERWYLDIDCDELCLPWNSRGLGSSQGTLAHTVDADGSNRFASYIRVTQTDELDPDSFSMADQAWLVRLNSIGGWKNVPDNPEKFPVLDGRWTMALELNYRDLSSDYRFDRDYIIEQPEVEMTGAVRSEAGEPISIRFDRLSISPVSATFFISLEEDLNDEFLLLESLSLVSGLRLEDGRIITSRYSLIDGEAAQYTSGGTTSGRRGEDGRHYYC